VQNIVASGEETVEDLLVFVIRRSARLLSQEGQCFTDRRINAAWCISRISCSNIRTSKGGIFL